MRKYTLLLLVGLLGCLWGCVPVPPNPTPHWTPYFKGDVPTVLYISGAKWDVIIGDEDWDRQLELDGFDGESICVRHIISIHSDLPVARERDAILHEILHAGSCQEPEDKQALYYNSPNMKHHEQGFGRISVVLTTTLHDNPELTLYLAGIPK